MSKYWSSFVADLDPYTPGEQPAINNLTKLNTNENPYGPSPKVLQAMEDAVNGDLRLYPPPNADQLKQTIADYYQLNTDQVFVGNGSDEVLAHVFNALFRQTQGILFPDISYSSLAGLRIGYAMGSAELIEGLERVKNSFNSYPLGHVQIAAGVAAFKDSEYFEETRQLVINSRVRLTQQLESLGFETLPSAANFVFARHPGYNAEALAQSLREKNIIVRHFDKPRINDFLRITVGSEEQNQLLIECLHAIIG